MNPERFDDLTRSLGRSVSRRSLLKAALGLAAGGVLSRVGRGGAREASAQGFAPDTGAFLQTWERTDRPVQEGRVSRTWMWGPAFTAAFTEPYQQAPGGQRLVQYFDKSRMEDNSFNTTDAPWNVSNGLLVSELISGSVQVGDAQFDNRQPAQVNVAGDADDPTGPTYASFLGVIAPSSDMTGQVITRRINRAGTVSTDGSLAGRNVANGPYIIETGHNVAQPFWDFMNSSGQVYQNGQFVNDKLFINAFYATGFPVTDAYWANVKVANTYKDVLMQCFQRRCLTYTPDNPPGWQVEAGNVGQHYHTWRTSGPQVDPLLATLAPAHVTQQLQAGANADPKAQALRDYLFQLGLAPTTTYGVQASQGGVDPRTALFQNYEQGGTAPLGATIVYTGAELNPVAIVTNADNSTTALLSVGAGGQIQTTYGPDGASAQAARAYPWLAAQRGLARASVTGSRPDGWERLWLSDHGEPAPESVAEFPRTLAASTCDQTDACERCKCGCDAFEINLDLIDDRVAVGCTMAAFFVCHSVAPITYVGEQYDGWVDACLLAYSAFCAIKLTCPKQCKHVCEPPTTCSPTTLISEQSGTQCCDGELVDTNTSDSHCGGCGNAVPFGYKCCNGTPTWVKDNTTSNCGGCGQSCTDPTKQCVNFQCVTISQQQCQTNADCGNQVCFGGRCVPCVANGECAVGQICQAGICIACAGQQCSDGTCSGAGQCCPGYYMCGGQCISQNTCCGVCGSGYTCQGCPSYCCPSTGTCYTPGTCCPEWYSCPGAEPPCCPPAYPQCANGPGGRNCCPSGLPVSCPNNWCCPSGCLCDGHGGCDCSHLASTPVDEMSGATLSMAGASGMPEW